MIVDLWNSKIREAVNENNAHKALYLFRQMKQNGLEPNNLTFPFVSKACAKVSNLEYSQVIHTHIIKSPFYSNVFVQTAMLDMYVKCNQLDMAYNLFVKMPKRDVASWNVMLVGFAQLGFPDKVFHIFQEMRSTRTFPDSITILGLSQAISCVKNLELAKGVHAFGIRIGIDTDVSVANTWISLYAKCGDLEMAKSFLMELKPDISTIISLLSSCVLPEIAFLERDMDEALNLFNAMEAAGETPDLVTVLSMISGCSQTGILGVGMWIDAYANSNCLKHNVVVCNALIDMYAKCGSICDARDIFNTMPNKTVVSWTTMIAGFALNGLFEEALDLFYRMVELELKPNHITFLAILQACTHGGFLEEGWECFNMMTKIYKISPGLDHYSCMADLLGRKGKLKEALKFIQDMPVEPDAAIWSGLLSACKIHQNIEIGEYAAHRLFKMEPCVSFPYVEMANIYASTGRWDGVARMRAMMKSNRIKKSPGQSLVEVNGRICAFTVEDTGHFDRELIYAVLDGLMLQSKEEGPSQHSDGTPELELETSLSSLKKNDIE
ncbi:hypothetical protein GH714_036909 [Hevea brasiliensis]|uniref:Pentacotripeptide-repeat region of PRORP domain-containing protein n=1 Tax=Hevea brasiliensis TaxID=3981 RepID=A0A6A6KVW3_HEVBR|nr:hypothetical protein GH714_036909 [Hevea brasiliensis]